MAHEAKSLTGRGEMMNLLSDMYLRSMVISSSKKQFISLKTGLSVGERSHPDCLIDVHFLRSTKQTTIQCTTCDNILF